VASSSCDTLQVFEAIIFWRELMTAYVIFDVDIRDAAQYQQFMSGVTPALEEVSAKYLARGGSHKIYEGDWTPRRIVLIEFPSVAAWEEFYNGATYQGLKHIRDGCSSSRLVSVEGLD
jgi:uncharacterized protein (DUF1330 family)